MGYACLVFIGIVVLMYISVVPGLIMGLIGHWKYKTVRGTFVYFLLPYLFLFVMVVGITIGGLIVYNCNGLDFFGGDVREVPLAEEDMRLSVCDYDRDNGLLIWRDGEYEREVNSLAFAEDSIYCRGGYHPQWADAELGNAELTIEDYGCIYDYAILIPSTGEVIEIDCKDPLIEDIEWISVDSVFKERESEMTANGMILVMLLSLLFSIVACAACARLSVIPVETIAAR